MTDRTPMLAPSAGCPSCGARFGEFHGTNCPMSHQRDVERLADGIQAALTIRLIAGEVDQTYTANEVAKMVASVVREQVARFTDTKEAT